MAQNHKMAPKSCFRMRNWNCCFNKAQVSIPPWDRKKKMNDVGNHQMKPLAFVRRQTIKIEFCYCKGFIFFVVDRKWSGDSSFFSLEMSQTVSIQILDQPMDTQRVQVVFWSGWPPFDEKRLLLHSDLLPCSLSWREEPIKKETFPKTSQ